jgi:hypothetical protein
MNKHGPARATAAAVAVAALTGFALAGCGGPSTHTTPDVPGESTGSMAAGASSLTTSAAKAGRTRPDARQSVAKASGQRQNATSNSFVQANSIPFPVAVGNTWVYRTNASGETGRTTNSIVAAGPGTAGYQVTMSSTIDIAGTSTTLEPVYVFYPDGTVGYPLPPVDGVSVAGNIRWPDAAGLASGQAYHSVLRIQSGQGGPYENANVTVQGAGTTSVSVPAGRYQASVVDTTIATNAVTIEVKTWIAQGTGTVKTVVLIQAAGGSELNTTSELVSFTKAAAGIGS